MFLNILIVGIGGFVGAIARYLISAGVQSIFSRSLFPFGTLAVNLLGCMIMGFLCAIALNWGVLTPRAKLLLMTGFLGALTTFSTFSNETFDLIKNSEMFLAFVNVGVQVVFGLFFIWFGYFLAYILKIVK
jgi:fluoride exporter